MKKKIWIGTYGCQMNERDSEEAIGMLIAQGYTITAKPEGADVILLNTCSVRERAEEKAYGRMADLTKLKRKNPDVILGMIGCMAKLHQDKIFKQIPDVDLVAGPAELYDLPLLLGQIQQKRQQQACSVTTVRKVPQQATRVMAVGRAFRPLDAKPAGEYRKRGVRAYVSIIEGCDKTCTYCIVPTTRGQEISRPAEAIMQEINQLHAQGYREVILLGQNVNSYGKRFPDGTGYKGPLGRLRLLEDDPDSLLDFAQLLRLIDRRTHIPRVRFTTSHPFDANERMFDAMRDSRCVCEYVHLPVQSGSNRMLRAMRRGYTVELYLKKLAQLRQRIPEVTLSTDIIVGFPGETEQDFAQTVALIKEVGYDNAYIFKYSPRPGTDAARVEDSIAQNVKEERNQILLDLLNEMSLKKHQALEGTREQILIEEKGRKSGQWFGRTRRNHGVIVDSTQDLLGQFVDVRMVRATAHTLFANVTSQIENQIL